MENFVKRECISINIGQAGVQMGNSCWELYCAEHGIEPDGTMKNIKDESSSHTFFTECVGGSKKPRTLMIDLEPSVIDQIKTGRFRSLYNANQLITGKEDAANNYARGYYSTGMEIVDKATDVLRLYAEECDNLQGFLISHSTGGGTGSGFTALLKEKLNMEYSKKTRLNFSVYPSARISTATVEPYNAVLAAHSTLQYPDCNFMLQNEPIYNICNRKLEIENPTYVHLNTLVSQVMSSVTMSLRFGGVLNMDLHEFETNLVPYPRIHFPVVSFAPIRSTGTYYHDTQNVIQMTTESFHPQNQMVNFNCNDGKFIASCLLYRGDVVMKDVNSSINALKLGRQMKFVPWCLTGFKVALNNQPPTVVEIGPSATLAPLKRSVTSITNSTSIVQSWSQLTYKFDLMFHKRAFVHWYVAEGMEESEFLTAREDLACLENDYMEVEGHFEEDNSVEEI